ncbi:hypothetical protein AUK22_08950 [bacterium CG2_30_54_10]|nr:MAG: hypothetical protein AUK22_08950 [bacterium CG2_30_54_10]
MGGGLSKVPLLRRGAREAGGVGAGWHEPISACSLRTSLSFMAHFVKVTRMVYASQRLFNEKADDL